MPKSSSSSATKARTKSTNWSRFLFAFSLSTGDSFQVSGSTLSAQMTIISTNGRLVAEGMSQIVDRPDHTITVCQPKQEFASSYLVEKNLTVSEWIKWTVCLAKEDNQPTTMDLFIKSYELKRSRVHIITNVLVFDFGLDNWIEFNVLESKYLDTRHRLEEADREATGQTVIHGAWPAQELDPKLSKTKKAKRGQKRTQEAVSGKQVNPKRDKKTEGSILHTYSTSTMEAPQNDPQQVNREATLFSVLHSIIAGQTCAQFGNQLETHPALNEVDDDQSAFLDLLLGEDKARKDIQEEVYGQATEPLQTTYSCSATQTLQQEPVNSDENFVAQDSSFFWNTETHPTTNESEHVFDDLFQDDFA